MHQRFLQAHFFDFLKNKEMNEIYLSYGISNFALGLVSIFVPIYLYNLGYSILWILFYYFLLPLNAIIFAKLGAMTVARVGVRQSILISVIFKILFFACLNFLPNFSWLFLFLPTLNTLKTMFSSYSYHLNFLEHSDSKHRGSQVSTLQAVALAANLLSPLIGGFVIAYFGFSFIFVAAIFLIIISALPILALPETKTSIPFDTKNLWGDIFTKKNRPMISSYGGYAIEEWIGFVVWSLFLFLMFKNTEAIGSIHTTVAAVTFLVFYAVGKLSDRYDKKKLIKFATILYFFAWVGRIFVNSATSVIFVDSYKGITANLLQVPWNAYSYDLAAKRNYFRFIVQREILFDLSRVLMVPTILFIFALNIKPFLFSFIMAAIFSLLYMNINQQEV